MWIQAAWKKTKNKQVCERYCQKYIYQTPLHHKFTRIEIPLISRKELKIVIRRQRTQMLLKLVFWQVRRKTSNHNLEKGALCHFSANFQASYQHRQCRIYPMVCLYVSHTYINTVVKLFTLLQLGSHNLMFCNLVTTYLVRELLNNIIFSDEKLNKHSTSSLLGTSGRLHIHAVI